MTTKRKRSKSTARAGVNYVRSIVDNHNCIFQEIDLDNDIGNDAYIEFIQDEDATGCCIAIQIKSGESYVSSSGEELVLKADREHFEYWASHILPIGAIIFDPQSNTAAWLDVTAFLKANPERILDGPYNIAAPKIDAFSDRTFEIFRNHFLKYKDEYAQTSNFALALENFANLANPEQCFDGIRALFSFHRQRMVLA